MRSALGMRWITIISMKTDPHPIRRIRLKLPLKNILSFVQPFFLLVVPLGIESYTFQAHFPHEFCGILRRDAGNYRRQKLFSDGVY